MSVVESVEGRLNTGPRPVHPEDHAPGPRPGPRAPEYAEVRAVANEALAEIAAASRGIRTVLKEYEAVLGCLDCGHPEGAHAGRWGDYTPGPWVEDDDHCIFSPVWSETHAANIAIVDSRMPHWPANKRLIAKAYLIPQLEAALKEATRRLMAIDEHLATPRMDGSGIAAAREIARESRGEFHGVLAELRRG